MPTIIKKIAVALTASMLSSVLFADFLPRPEANPYAGMDGAASMHGDTASSDTTPYPGPGSQGVSHRRHTFLAACPTLVVRTDGYPFALCTNMLTRDPEVRLLNPDTGSSLDKLRLSSSSLLGGVYAYIDHQDRLVMIDGDNNLVRVKAQEKGWWLFKYWQLSIDSSVSLSPVLSHCDGDFCDGFVALTPGYDGAVWFATQQAMVGYYQPQSDTLEWIQLGEGEQVHNSFSTADGGRTAVATDHALYLLTIGSEGVPQVAWRHAYDRGPVRKPGQLSHGTGATPTFFGPVSGSEYLTITDNAAPIISLLVLDASAQSIADGGIGGHVYCQHELFSEQASGTENSSIASGSSIITASTYGYPYPAEPAGVAPAVPAKADFVGGMIRVDIRPDASGCDVVWESPVRSAAVPRLSTADNLIYTIERIDNNGDLSASVWDEFHFTVMDPDTGDVLQQDKIGAGFFSDTLEMVGNIGHDQVIWVGTLSGIIRVAPQQ